MKTYFVRVGIEAKTYADSDKVIKIVEVEAKNKRDAHNLAEKISGLYAIGSYVEAGLTSEEIKKLRKGALEI